MAKNQACDQNWAYQAIRNKEVAAPPSLSLFISSTAISIVISDSRGRKHYFDPPDSAITRQWLQDLNASITMEKKK